MRNCRFRKNVANCDRWPGYRGGQLNSFHCTTYSHAWTNITTPVSKQLVRENVFQNRHTLQCMKTLSLVIIYLQTGFSLLSLTQKGIQCKRVRVCDTNDFRIKWRTVIKRCDIGNCSSFTYHCHEQHKGTQFLNWTWH